MDDEIDIKPGKHNLKEDSEQMLIEALHGFLLALSEDGDIIFTTENIAEILGLQQVFASV